MSRTGGAPAGRPAAVRTLAVGAAVLGLLAVLPPERARAEPFLDAYTGINLTRDTDLSIKQPVVNNDFRVHGVSFDQGFGEGAPYYGVRAGYFFGEDPAWLGLAVELFHFKVVAETDRTRDFTGTLGGQPISGSLPMNGLVQSFSLTNGLSYLTLDVIVRHGLLVDDEDYPHGRLQLYAGIGAGAVIAYPRSTIQGASSEPGYQFAGAGAQGFAGVRFLLFPNVGIFAEGKLTYARLSVDVARGGTAEMTDQSLHLVAGITLMFP